MDSRSQADHSLPPRKSRRNLTKQKQSAGFTCRCGFSHDLKSVRCRECGTWQHVYCYYGTEDDKDFNRREHVCDTCGKTSPNDLESKLNLLKVEQQTAKDSKSQRLGPFESTHDEQIMWGPDDEEISRDMERIQMTIKRVAYSLDAELKITAEAVFHAKNPDTNILIQQVFGMHEEWQLRPEMIEPQEYPTKRRRLIEALVIAALTCWVFSIPRTQEKLLNYDSALLFHYQQLIFKRRK